jgi:hypothetical protein
MFQPKGFVDPTTAPLSDASPSMARYLPEATLLKYHSPFWVDATHCE